MNRYTEKEIERLRSNPNVRYIDEKRLSLTLEFRLKLYDVWEKEKTIAAIRRILDKEGILTAGNRNTMPKRMKENFEKYGRPKNGDPSRSRVGSSKDKRQREQEDVLLQTGKFIRRGRGIAFSPEFIEELRTAYPKKSVEEMLRDAGIDPAMVGYYRVYMLGRKLSAASGEKETRASPSWNHRCRTSAEIRMLQEHPYVARVSERRLAFREDFYQEASEMFFLGMRMEEIERIFELPEMPKAWRTAYYYKLKSRAAEKSNCPREKISFETLSSSGQEQYLRIQRNQVQAWEGRVNQNWETLKTHFPQLNPIQKKKVCEVLRDEFPWENRGDNSVSGLLKRIGISKSHYYRILQDDYTEAYEARKVQEQKDMEDVRHVAEYGGYPKGSRQISMQMPILANRVMSRKKVIRLCRKMGLRCTVRKANPGLRAARRRLQTHVKPNLLKRTFKLHRPGEVYLTDVTYLSYNHGRSLAYGSALIDSVTGRLHEFTLSAFNDLELALTTIRSLPRLEDVRTQLQPMLHSDQGVLYLADEFQELLKELGFAQSMSKRGNCWDNAPQESFFGHFKDEVNYARCTTLEELQTTIKQYKHYFNEVRGQWNRNRMTPVQYEKYLLGMTDEEFEKWLEKEQARYEAMKQRAREKAIERNKTLGV